MFAIMPTNRKLTVPIENAGAHTRRMLETWGRLHAIRSLLGLLATLCFVIGTR
jgi:hypothetical protein